MNAVIYSKENCPYCTKAKILLTKLGIAYEEFIIQQGTTNKILAENQYWTTKEHLLEKAPNAKTVPQIWLDGEHVGGYTELEKRFPQPVSTAV